MKIDAFTYVGRLNPYVNGPRQQQWSGGRETAADQADPKAAESGQDQSNADKAQGEGNGPARELTESEKRMVTDLKARDAEVRAHEMAHISAGGKFILQGARFQYQRGPDGHSYAVGGEVSIDVSEEPSDPQATIQKMQVVRRAALAPSDPSPQDRRVAAIATRKEGEAQVELANLIKAERAQKTSEASTVTPTQAPAGQTEDVATGQGRKSTIQGYGAAGVGGATGILVDLMA